MKIRFTLCTPMRHPDATILNGNQQDRTEMKTYLSGVFNVSHPAISSNSSNSTSTDNATDGSEHVADNAQSQLISVNELSSKTVEGLASLDYVDHIMSTLVLLFYLFALPVIVVIFVVIWRTYLNACESCERTLSRRHSVTHSVVDMQDFRLRHECCKKNVAPILFALPTDFNFKHNCGAKCKGPKVWQPDTFP